MPLQLRSRTTTDTARPRSTSPLATPASKPQIPTICLTTATPCDPNSQSDPSQVAPWITSEASPVPIAPKSLKNGEISRKRLVPKKSKLSLLGSSSSSTKAREQDFSDLVRRIGGASADNGGNGFEIYVDPANDPDIGEILMVKKKKSRLALDGMQWGMLGEVTNVPSVTKPEEKGRKKENPLKGKVDENQKWWSIGRGRKDSKEKDKDKDKIRAKSPEPAEKSAETRARFNSLGSGTLLTNAINPEQPKSAVEHLRMPAPPSAAGKNSVAIRAMRSVRSLARIGSWAQLKNTPHPDVTPTVVAPVKDKEPDGKKKKKKDKEKGKDKDKGRETIRYSGSSFEAGGLSTSPSGPKSELKSLGKKKASILGLGLPSTIRLPSSRGGSTTSSIVAAHTGNRRLSADSATLLGGGILARGRSGSTMSTASSLRPMSTKSRESSGSSGTASVKWDEAGLQTVKEIRRKEKENRSKEKEIESKEKNMTKKSKIGRSEKDSMRKLSGRKTPLTAIFPGTVSRPKEDESKQSLVSPINMRGKVTVHDWEPGRDESGSQMETPVKRVRPRPVSEQLLSRNRSKPFHDGDDENAVMSRLDAATNDLAQLINRLDLEATPCSVDMSPISQRSPFLLEPSANSSSNGQPPEVHLVKGLRNMNFSMSSIRPYPQSKSTGVQLGQNIAPWSMLNADISPSKPSSSTIRIDLQDNMATVRRQTLSPAPAADPSPVFKALRPAATRLPISKTTLSASSGISPLTFNTSDRPPSTLTFGSNHSKSDSRGSLSPSPVFKKAQKLSRKGSSLTPHAAALDNDSLPILPEVRRSLGLSGTMGSSVGSIVKRDYDASDPNSDIPDELHVILSNSDQGEDTISFDPKQTHLPSSPGSPPEMPLPTLTSTSPRGTLAIVPVFRATVTDHDHHADVEEAETEDDTKRSFDFTGELQKLNESGASDRRSFIEQLENAFRTPANVDLHYDFDDLPPIPKLNTLQDELSRAGKGSFNLPTNHESRERLSRGSSIDVNMEPTMLPESDNFATSASDEELLDIIAPHVLQNRTVVACGPSRGELNRDFKFGGKHSKSSNNGSSPLTLSDIIPPPEVARSLSMASLVGDESSLMKSILAHAVAVDTPSQCLYPQLESDSDTGSERETRAAARNSYLSTGHKRNSSVLSFAGLDSFAEVRRGFEFSDSRPGFYPPPVTSSDKRNRKHESIYSIASVSSYGNVLHGGSADPFDYGSVVPLSCVRERPSSDDFSFTASTSVDDTFSFLRKQPLRRRVDSDASSFYFRMSLVHPYNRGHRRHGSGVSIGPPISILNRNSAYHRHRDSNASISSVAQSYANCRRFSWTHQSDFSVEPVLGDLSGTNLGRPGLGDKMLDSALGHPTPLASISASPPPSLASSLRGVRARSAEYDNRVSYDSIMDSQYEYQKTDSLSEKTDNRYSVCSSDSMFFEQHSDDAATKPPRYRPISSLSIPSVHSPPKEDDTMISLLGGGRIRRRSVTSTIGASPCIQLEAERRKNILANPPETVFSRIKNTHRKDLDSPETSRVIEAKPSIASTTGSSQFGDERMIRARHGLLQSPENTVPLGDGEDLSGSFRMPVFSRPSRTNRSRSSTCTSSSGADTPPLSISDGFSSFSEGSLSSIDLSQLNTLLSNPTRSSPNVLDRARPFARGHGHRRRISQARAERTSVYETIQEEFTSSLSPTNSPVPTSNTVKFGDVAKTVDLPQVYIVDSETSSVDSFSLWDDEQGITALRRFYALRDEAEDTVMESKRTWLDTPFSVFATQSFDPPRHPLGMQEMLAHSLQNYGPLPSDLRPRRMRSRVNSRPSPYPRTAKTSFTSSPSAEHLRAAVAASLATPIDNAMPRQPSPLSNALKQVTINPNLPSTVIAEPKERIVSPDKPGRIFGLPPQPRVGATARRTAPGWSKRSTGRNAAENKENNTTRGPPAVNMSQGTIMTSADGLRLNRPRPKGRPTPASARPIRA